MKYTKDQLEVMSDFEITAIVMEKRGWLVKRDVEDSLIGFNAAYHDKYPSTVWCAPTDEHGNQSDSWQQVNCCYSWADMGPIIQESKISIKSINIGYDTWCCERYGFYEIGNNPLRAAAIVYLLMEE